MAEIQGHGNNDHASWWTFDDEDSVRERWWTPQAGETVFDIGAAFGSYALPALASGARVVCFSPADFDTELLEKNLSLNPELEPRCKIVRDALYSADGWFNPVNQSFSTEEKAGDPWLKTTTLDAFLDARPGIGRVDWLKIDVEGAELHVLKGAEKALRMYRPKICVENHEQYVPGVGAAVRDYLVGLGVGYVCDGPVQYHSISHSFFQAR